MEGFGFDGPNFSFPDLDMDDIMKMGNIEEFFNENFFKKTRRRTSTESYKNQKNDEFLGVPESHYEPTTSYLVKKRKGEEMEEFHPGNLMGFSSLENQESTTQKVLKPGKNQKNFVL